ncbi:hypothetical protein OOU_Y34scaffold00533g23 [Pyricularia oryzae Y34]|uniref:Uncharacterized protein n=2 Tax=Pyricularia oryzae TaxID=318829 RepID=A0AA97NYJ4_PYRO3|nr:hypothetical protein OOU_Y34scaffold00533g23 [Pyricularia oryzae Y34]
MVDSQKPWHIFHSPPPKDSTGFSAGTLKTVLACAQGWSQSATYHVAR